MQAPGTNSVSYKWDSSEWRAVRNKLLHRWFLGNEEAVEVYLHLSNAAEIWDDLVDQDRAVTPEEATSVFEGLLIGLPTNSLYVKFHPWITALSVVVANAYHDANELQRRSPGDKMTAFHLRRMGVEFACLLAFCVGGYSHLRSVSLEIRGFFYSEMYEDWEHSHVTAH